MTVLPALAEAIIDRPTRHAPALTTGSHPTPFRVFMKPSPEDPLNEARHLLRVAGGLKPAIDILMTQFNVLQTRAQLLLTLATLALTITGFSGPRIASAGAFSCIALAIGLILVLISVVLILSIGLRVRWVTQFRGETDEALLVAIIEYRNAKTRAFGWQLAVLGAGLTAYVAGVATYFLLGAP